MVDASFGKGGFTTIHSKIAEGFPSTINASVQLLAERGADLHLVGCKMGYEAGGLPRHAYIVSYASVCAFLQMEKTSWGYVYRFRSFCGLRTKIVSF
jgi:hypothetical protein